MFATNLTDDGEKQQMNVITGTKEESADWMPDISQYIERRIEALVTECLETRIHERVAQA